MPIVEVANGVDIQTTIHVKGGTSVQLTARINHSEDLVGQPISLLTNAISEATESINKEMVRLVSSNEGLAHFGLCRSGG